MSDQVHVPFLTKDELRRRANSFLNRTHPSGQIPVPIELIVEQALRIHIVPTRDLQRTFDLVGCTSADGNIIFVDRWVAESRENRYRSTLAHEVAHLELHRGILEQMRTVGSDIEARAKLAEWMSDDMYRSFEWQAYTFAGLVLVPQEHLADAVRRFLPDIHKLIQRSEEKGIPRAQVVDYAWEELAAKIGPLFMVSQDVIHKRLDFDGFLAAQL